MGEKIGITIVDTSNKACSDQVGLVVGSEIMATVMGFGGSEHQDCIAAQAKVDVSGWRWTFASEVYVDGTIVGSYDITNGTCSARANVALIVPISELRVRVAYGDCGTPCAATLKVDVERD